MIHIITDFLLCLIIEQLRFTLTTYAIFLELVRSLLFLKAADLQSKPFVLIGEKGYSCLLSINTFVGGITTDKFGDFNFVFVVQFLWFLYMDSQGFYSCFRVCFLGLRFSLINSRYVLISELFWYLQVGEGAVSLKLSWLPKDFCLWYVFFI